ncbi:MAG: hypothetical protein E7292_01205 [Lachnospiraceae bacterium]|nr:hypothetical protein [Lachnospiraceae bacterium]
MKNYEKPVVLVNEELAEGVYAASGDCYTVTAKIVQLPELGKDWYTIQMDGVHDAQDGHHSSERVIKVVFNQVVTYQASNAESVSGSGSNILYLTYVQGNGSYHNNAQDTLGLGNLEVVSEPGLAINSVSCSYCSRSCFDGH